MNVQDLIRSESKILYLMVLCWIAVSFAVFVLFVVCPDEVPGRFRFPALLQASCNLASLCYAIKFNVVVVHLPGFTRHWHVQQSFYRDAVMRMIDCCVMNNATSFDVIAVIVSRL